MVGRLILVLGDQLTDRVAALRKADRQADIVVMAEGADETGHVPHHPRKIALIFAEARGRPPPKPAAKKTNPVNAEFVDRTKDFLVEAMRQQGVTVEQLTERLTAIGVVMSRGDVANELRWLRRRLLVALPRS